MIATIATEERLHVIRFLQLALQDATDILEDLVTEVDAEMMAERPNLRLLVDGEPPAPAS